MFGCECGARDFLIVEVKHLASDDLIILMSLAGYQHEVAALRFRDRLMNRVAAIRDLAVRLAGLPDSLLRVAQDLLRVFHAWIVGSQNHDVAQTSRRLSHRRTL